MANQWHLVGTDVWQAGWGRQSTLGASTDRLPSTGSKAAEKPSKTTMKNNATRRCCQMPAACGRGALNELVSECPKMPGSFFLFFADCMVWQLAKGRWWVVRYKHSMLLSTCCRIWLNKSKSFPTRAATFCCCCLPVLIVRLGRIFYIVLFTQQLTIVVVIVVVVQL